MNLSDLFGQEDPRKKAAREQYAERTSARVKELHPDLDDEDLQTFVDGVALRIGHEVHKINQDLSDVVSPRIGRLAMLRAAYTMIASVRVYEEMSDEGAFDFWEGGELDDHGPFDQVLPV